MHKLLFCYGCLNIVNMKLESLLFLFILLSGFLKKWIRFWKTEYYNKNIIFILIF